MDALLVAMVIIWAGNYSLVKAVLHELPPLAFNAGRLIVASVVFLALLAWSHASRAGLDDEAGGAGDRPLLATGPFAASGHIAASDWITLAGLGFVGHFAYQLAFIGGLARTSVGNSALIIGCSPVAIALATAVAGHERIGRLHWLGAALSVGGLYLVAGRNATVGRTSLVGDLLMLGAVCCWAVYTVFSRPLLERHSPLVVTGYSMALGTAMFVPATIVPISRAPWTSLSVWAWLGILASAVLALNLAYLIWYTAVQRIGNARTSMYSNMVPVTAMLMAWIGLGEHIVLAQVAGAAAILAGVLLTRWSTSGSAAVRVEPPAEG
jgi:drug/metabolite transporter (DMT)-like permease